MPYIIDPYGILGSKEPLFRISSYENAINSLIGKYLWFSRPNEWKDPYELFFYNATYDGRPFGLKDRCFVACLTPIRISEAQWFMYGNGATNCLRFDFNKSVLQSVLHDFCVAKQCRAYIEPIRYDAARKIKIYNPHSINSAPYKTWSESDWIQLLTLKRNAYKYENEVRIILVFDETPNNTEKGIMLPYECAHTHIINQIQLHPAINRAEEKVTRLLLEKLFSFVPMHDKSGRLQPTITQSRLYQAIKPKSY